jgi:hypothetical protein
MFSGPPKDSERTPFTLFGESDPAAGRSSFSLFGEKPSEAGAKEFSLFGVPSANAPRDSNDQKDGRSDLPPAVGLGILALLAAAIFSGGTGAAKFARFYFELFEALYLGALALIGLVVAAAWWFLARRTDALKKRWELLSPASDAETGILAGKTLDGLNLYVPPSARLGHVQILGATGRGKTESAILPWLVRDLKDGHSAILIDGKGDPTLARRIKDVTQEAATPPRVLVFDLGNPDGSCVVNPLAHGTPQQITDRLFAAMTFEESYYRKVQSDICRDMVTLIQEVDGKDGKDGTRGVVTFRRLHELLTSDDAAIEAAGRSTNQALRSNLAKFLGESPKTREPKISGLVSQLGPFAVGEVAALVNGASGSTETPEMSCSELLLSPKTDEPCVLIVLIPTLKYQEIGHQLGKLLLQELGWAVGERASRCGENAAFVPVYLDEFSAFVYPGFHNILNKARSSHVALHLSHQSLGDLSMVSPDFATVVNTNCNVKCLLGLNDPETADFFARHLGTSTEEKATERAKRPPLWGKAEKTGDVSLREVEAYKIHPNRLKNFTCGQGVLHMPSPRGNITEEIQFAALGAADSLAKEVR